MNISKIFKRRKWKNYVSDQFSDPLNYFKATSLSDLIEIIRRAREKGFRIKPLGSGHSSSDIAVCADYMIDTHGLKQVLDVRKLSLTASAYVDHQNLFLVECGIVLKDLIKFLDSKGKALINMGAYTGQTIAGVVSTSTHGSGKSLGAFPSYVEAIIFVDENGELSHVERSGDKAISTAAVSLEGVKNIRFVSNDDDFNALAVSIGCIGIIYALVIRVTDSYMLKETRRFSTWTEIKHELLNGKVLDINRHFEVLVSPYRYGGKDHKCLVTERNINYEKKGSPLIPRGHRKLAYELPLLLIPNFVINGFMRTIINRFPKLIPSLVQMLISTLTDKDYIDKSFKVLDLGRANNLSAYATEIAFPSDQFINAVQRIIDIVNESVSQGEQYLSAPFSLRFVKTNSYYLSMQYGNENDYVCMIEFPTVNKTTGGMELLYRIESAMYPFGGKPHWGQINHVGGNKFASPARLYPKFNDWLIVHGRYCKLGIFQNDFTRRCMID